MCHDRHHDAGRRRGADRRKAPHRRCCSGRLLGGRTHPIPASFALLAPARLGPLLALPLLGWPGKLRALGERFVAPGDAADESVAAFVRRRFGAELLDNLVEPIVGAIYMADLERLSLAATFLRFLSLERQHGNLTRALAPQIAPTEPPAWSRVHRHENVLAQPGVGHLDRVEGLQALAANLDGLELSGGPVGAYGLPDVIAAGEAAAEKLLDRPAPAARR